MSTIQLGAPGALRKYLVKARGDGIMWGRSPANPFSAKVNSSNKYDQVDIWNEWVQEDWQAGVGRVDAEAGGFLYGEVDTRVPNQLILSPVIGYATPRLNGSTTDYWGHLPASASAYTTLDIGNGTNYQRFAAKMTYDVSTAAADAFAIFSMSVYAKVNNGVGLTFAVYSDNSTSPNASLVSGTLTTADDSERYIWFGVTFTTLNVATPNSNATYWAVVYPTSASHSMTLVGTATNASSASATYNGSAWAALTTFFPFFHVATGHRGASE